MFGHRFHIGTIAGFKIGVDISWFFIAFLLSWTLASGYFPLRYPGIDTGVYWLMGIAGMLGLFICVILHELGHAIVARHYKLPVTQITLFIFGGVAELQKEPTSPKVEFWMAIAGPIVSFALAFLLYWITQLGIQQSWPIAVQGVTSYLWVINLVLAIFNLIPAFPLDGGRVLRAILWGAKKNLEWATRISATIGSAFGFALIFLGILSFFRGAFLSGLWFVILGWFLNRAASSVKTQFYVGRELEGEAVEKFMKKEVISAPPNITVKEFAEKFVYVSHHHLYPVTENGIFLGYVTLKEIRALSLDQWERTTVREIMVHPEVDHLIGPTTSALTALDVIQKSDLTTLFVVDQGKLIGILTAQDLFKTISLKLDLEEKFRR